MDEDLRDQAIRAMKILAYLLFCALLAVGMGAFLSLVGGCVEPMMPASVIIPTMNETVGLDVLGTNEAPVAVSVIHIDSMITHETVHEFDTALEYASNYNTEVLIVDIDSLGGNVMAANQIAADLNLVPVPTVCVVRHLAASAAFLLFELCQVRVMEPAATLMAHEAYMPTDTPDLATYLSGLIGMDTFNDQLQKAECDRMKISLAECGNHFRNGKEWWIGSTEAILVGATDLVWTEKSVIEHFQYPSG